MWRRTASSLFFQKHFNQYTDKDWHYVPPTPPRNILPEDTRRIIVKKQTDDYRTQSLFIKYKYSYMFRPRQVVIRLALEHFKRNVQIGLLDMMSHYILFGATAPQWAKASSFIRFLDHARRTTVGRTPLDKWSALRRDLYLTTHNTHSRQDSNPQSQQAGGRRPTPYISFLDSFKIVTDNQNKDNGKYKKH